MLYFTVTLNNRKLHSIQEHGPKIYKKKLYHFMFKIQFTNSNLYLFSQRNDKVLYKTKFSTLNSRLYCPSIRASIKLI